MYRKILSRWQRKKIQKLTDDKIKEAEAVTDKKVKEIMSV